MKTQELNQQEQKAINGGSLLGGDDNMFKAITQGYVNYSHTDEDGDTESTNISYGSGSLFQSESD